MIVPEKSINEVVLHLNCKGFVLDIDVTLWGTDSNFGNSVVMSETLLRDHGYNGGPLRAWSSSFNGTQPAYGARDESKNLQDKDLLEYCLLKELVLDFPGLTKEKLMKHQLGIVFRCPKCRTQSIQPPSVLKADSPSECSQLRGRCRSCEIGGIEPTELQAILL